MSNICPICRNEFTKDICENCGFEMPTFAFLSEDDANEWYRDIVEPLRKAWKDSMNKIHCKNCGKELQEEWEACPFCGTSVKSRENGPVFSSLQFVRTFVGHNGSVTSVTFSPDGKYIASHSVNNTLKLWEAKGGWLIRTIEGERFGVFSQDSKYIIRGSGTLELREVESWEVARTIEGVQGYSATLSPDGKYIVSYTNDKIVKLWEAKNGQLVRTFIGQKGNDGDSFIFSPDGKYIASISLDFDESEVTSINNSTWTLKQWETESGRFRIIEGPKNKVSSFAFSSDSKYIVSGSITINLTPEETLKLWEAESGRLVHAFDEKHSVFAVAFSPDGKYIVSGSNDCTLKLWETESGRLVYTIEEHKVYANNVCAVAFSPDGKYIISGAYEGTLKQWELV